MEKDFDRWNERKKNINASRSVVRFHEREVWWCSIGLNIGDEEDGKNDLFERPVLILKKFNRNVAWIVPLTTKPHNDVFHYQLESSKTYLILPQAKLISSKRLIRIIEKITEEEIMHIFELFKNLYTLKIISTKSDSRPF